MISGGSKVIRNGLITPGRAVGGVRRRAGRDHGAGPDSLVRRPRPAAAALRPGRRGRSRRLHPAADQGRLPAVPGRGDRVRLRPVGCVLGAYLLQGPRPGLVAGLAAVAVAAYAVSMLMMHHFLDRDADMLADPPKVTSIVRLGLRGGHRYAVGWSAVALAAAVAGRPSSRGWRRWPSPTSRPGGAAALPPRRRRVGHPQRTGRDRLRRPGRWSRRCWCRGWRCAVAAVLVALELRLAVAGRERPGVSLQAELETTYGRRRLPRPDQRAVAVMPAEPVRGARLPRRLRRRRRPRLPGAGRRRPAGQRRAPGARRGQLDALAERAEEVSGGTTRSPSAGVSTSWPPLRRDGDPAAAAAARAVAPRRAAWLTRRRPAAGHAAFLDRMAARPASWARRWTSTPARRAAAGGRQGPRQHHGELARRADRAGSTAACRQPGRLRRGDGGRRGLRAGAGRRRRSNYRGELDHGRQGTSTASRHRASGRAAAVVRRFADPYMAGETLDEAVETVRGLNRAGHRRTVDVLGEASASPTRPRPPWPSTCALDAIAASSSTPTSRSSCRRSGSRSTPAWSRTLARVLTSAERAACSCASTWSNRAHRRHARPLPGPARGGPGRRRRRPPGLPAPLRRRPRGAGRPAPERAPGQGHLPGAARHRLPAHPEINPNYLRLLGS